MLKRLLTAVLVLGLILAFSSTAFSDPNSPIPRPEKERVIQPTGTHPSKVMSEPVPKALAEKSIVTPEGAVPPRQGEQAVDTNACYEQDYFSDYTGGGSVSLLTTSGNPSMAQVATKYDVYAYPTHVAVINKVYAVISRAVRAGTTAGLKVRLRIWSDVSGTPGSVVWAGSYTLPAVTAPGWYGLPVPNVQVAGPNYWVSIGNDSSAVAGDTLRLYVGNNPSGRSRYRSGGGTWYAMSAWLGSDYDLAMAVDDCEHYTSCYSEASFPGGSVWLIQAPDVWGSDNLNGFGQRFVSVGRETITGVDVYHLDYSGTYPGAYYSSTSTNGWTIELWNDDGAGNIDNAAGPFYTETVAGGASLFPNTGLAADGWNAVHVNFTTPQVVDGGPWHITVKATSEDPADGAFLFAANKETVNPGWSGGSIGFSTTTPFWQRFYLSAPWGNVENAFFIKTYRCKDEFYNCANQLLHDAPVGYGYKMYDGGMFHAVAQMVKGKDVNRVQKIRFQISKRSTPAGSLPGVQVNVWSWTASGPGSLIWSTVVTTPTYYPGWTEVVIPGGLQIANDRFYVGYQSDPANASVPDTLVTMTEDDASDPVGHLHSLINGGAWFLYHGTTWYSFSDGLGYTDNLVMEVEFCSIPPSVWACGTAADVRVEAGDYARTSHSNVSMTDAYCDLTLKWGYTESPIGYSNTACYTTHAIVYDTFVVAAFGSKYRILDLRDGSIIGTITDHVNPNGGVQATPSIATVTVGGTPKPLLFIAGGNTPQRTFSAYDMSTFTGAIPNAVPTEVWSINDATYGTMGYDDPDIPLGNTSYTNPVVLTIGGTDMVFFATNDLWLFGANAATGVKVWQLAIPGYSNKGLCTDGTYLYCTVAAIPGYFANGDILKINPATGAIVKQLSTGGGFKGTTMYPSNGVANEGFASGASYYDGQLYAVSEMLTISYSPTPAPDGIFYRVKTADMSVLSTSAAQHASNNQYTIGFPMVDETQVICPTRTTWSRAGVPSPTQAGSLIAYNRYTGAINYTAEAGYAGTVFGHRGDGLLTCEPDGAHNLLFVTNEDGFFSCFDAKTGVELFSRRWDNGTSTNTGAGVSISKDGDVLVSTFAGQLFCLTKQADRPRLSIPAYSLEGTTYGPLPSVNIPFAGVITNTGCADLTGNIVLSTTSNGSIVGVARRHDNTSKVSSIADLLTAGGATLAKGIELGTFGSELDRPASSRPLINNAAAATAPDWANVSTYPFTIASGESFDLVLDVNQSLIKRGPNECYAYIESNDPDYFLNNPTQVPQIQINIVGGCLLDTTTLQYGTNNKYYANNTGNLGDAEEYYHYVIDGTANTDFYAGFYNYGVSKHRMALWQSAMFLNEPASEYWKSLMPDFNDVDHSCKPALQTGVTLGQIWNGTGYTNLTGNVVVRNFLDSVVVMLNTSGVWSWNAWPGTYDNDSTMGLMVASRLIGFTNVPTLYPDLNYVTVDMMKVYQRDGKALPNWRMGVYCDYDLGGDTAVYFGSLSAGLAVGTGTRTAGAWGWIKIPYGGGCNGSASAPAIVNTKALDGKQSMSYTTSSTDTVGHGCPYLDSVYQWMGGPSTGTSQGSMSACANDQKFHVTVIKHDFTVDDTLVFGLAHVNLPTLANPRNPSSIAPISKLLNKWVGFDRGDVNNDGLVNLADIVYLADYVNGGGPGPMPFKHCGDVNVDNAVGAADYNYLIDYYFHYGPCPMSKQIVY